MLDVLKQSLHHDDACYVEDCLDLAIANSLQKFLKDDTLEIYLQKVEQKEIEHPLIKSTTTQPDDNPSLKKGKWL